MPIRAADEAGNGCNVPAEIFRKPGRAGRFPIKPARQISLRPYKFWEK
jgi:hypothetical protein